MKHLLLTALLTIIAYSASAGKQDSIAVVINNYNYVIYVGDSLQLGYGANPDGSFMYIYSGIDIPLEKSNAGKKVIIKAIRYIKATDEIKITLRGKGIYHLAYVPHAMEKGEIVSINGFGFD
ncbi:MAG: hypothetical protein R2852_08410 [Bacteroidia bacterium]